MLHLRGTTIKLNQIVLFLIMQSSNLFQIFFDWLAIYLQSMILREVFAAACAAALPRPRPPLPLPLPLPLPRPSPVPLVDVFAAAPRPRFPNE